MASVRYLILTKFIPNFAAALLRSADLALIYRLPDHAIYLEIALP